MALNKTETKLNENACRICLESPNPSTIKINSELLNIIVFCFGIEITSGPLHLCSKCAVYIIKYNDFKHKVVQSNNLWNSYALELSNKSIKDELIEDIKLEGPDSDVYYSDAELNGQPGEDIKLFPNDACREEVIKRTRRKTKDKKLKLKCEKCKKVYRRKDYLIRHQESCDVTVSEENTKTYAVFNCGLCSMTMDDEDKINEHINGHYSNNNLECKICGFIGTDFAEMEGHRYKHITKSKKVPKSCHICNQKFIEIMSLIFHFRSFHMNMKGSTCKHCNKFIKTYKAWKRHELSHTTYNYICDFCEKKFLQRNLIVEHMKQHLGVKEHICDICGKGFTRASYLRLHISVVHTCQEPVKCTHCDKVYKSQFHLDQHTKEVNMEKLFQCEHCLKFYSTEARLKSHMFWHTGERPFSCNICNATYKAKGTLKLHMKETHSSYRPYKCTICDKAFLTQQRLRRHNSMHTGVRKYKCLYCDRSFHSKSLLNTHCSSQHKTVIAQQHL